LPVPAEVGGTAVQPGTDAPGHDVLLIDGECGFCRGVSSRLIRWLPRGSVELRSAGQTKALEPFPGLDPVRCREAVHLVRADGRVFSGVDAIAEALRHGRRGWVARALRWPIVHPIAVVLYRLVARGRSWLPGGA